MPRQDKPVEALRIILLAVLLIITIYLTLFTIKAYETHITHWVYEDPETGELYWSYSPPGKLFPWPRPPGILTALSPMNTADQTVYKYLLKHHTVIPILVILYTTATYFAIRLVIRWRRYFSKEG